LFLTVLGKHPRNITERFEYMAGGKPGDKLYPLREDQFIAFSSDGITQYPAATVVLPSPKLGRAMRSGDVSEGWVLSLCRGLTAILLWLSTPMSIFSATRGLDRLLVFTDLRGYLCI